MPASRQGTCLQEIGDDSVQFTGVYASCFSSCCSLQSHHCSPAEHLLSRVQAVLEVYATHDIAIKPHVLLALVLYKVVDQVS